MLAIQFSDSINLGAILLGVMVLGAIAYFRIRSGVGEVWEDVAKGHEERAKLAQAQLQEAMTLIGDQKRQIERLEALPNLERIISTMADAQQRADDRADSRMTQAMTKLKSHDEHLTALVAEHDKKAQDRHDKQMEVMQEMQETQREMHEVFSKLNGH